MSIPVVTLPEYHAPFKPVPQVTPFTIRDGMTMLKKVDYINKYIQRVLEPWINENFSGLANSFETAVNTLITTINSSLAQQDANVDQKLADFEDYVTTVSDALTTYVNTKTDQSKTYVDNAVNSIINSTINVSGPVVAGVLANDVEAKKQVKNILDSGLMLVTSDRFSGIDAGGTTSSSPAINAALATAPNGTTVKFFGKLLLKSFITVPVDKDLTLDLSNCILVRDHSGPMLRAYATAEQSYSITGITTVTENVTNNAGGNNQSHTVNVLTISGTMPAWVPGDILRVYAKDIIPGENYNSDDIGPGNHMRQGEKAEVYKVVGNQVYLTGVLRDPYTIDPKVCRITKGTIKVLDPSFDVSDTIWDNKTSGNSIRMKGLIRPTIIRPRVIREVNYPIDFVATVSAVCQDPFIERLVNDPLNGCYGYAIHDSSSEGTHIYNINSSDQRHGWTDGTPVIPDTDTDPFNYGRTQNARLIGGTVRATSQSAWDTHHGGRGHSFVGCHAIAPYGSRNLFALRGEGHSVIGCKGVGGQTFLTVFNEDYSGESNKHYASDITAINTQQLIAINVHHLANHVNYNVRDSEINLVVDGVYADNVMQLIFARNCRVKMGGKIVWKLPPTVDSTPISLQNADVEIEGLDCDGMSVTSWTAGHFMYTTNNGATYPNTGSSLSVKGKIKLSDAAIAGLASSRTYFGSGDEDTLVFDILYNKYFSSNPHVIANTVRSVDSRWRYQPGNVDDVNQAYASTHMEVAGANIATESYIWRIGRSGEPQLFMTVVITDSVAREVAILPRGKFNGQRLLIQGRSLNAAATLKNGTAYRTSLGADITINTGTFVNLVWWGTTWVKVS